MNADAVAVTVFAGEAMAGRIGNFGEVADPAQGLLDLGGFHLELPLIPDVLVSAPAAGAEIGAARLDAIRRRHIHGDQVGLGKFLLSAVLSRAVTCSPAMTKGTKTASPSARPTPFPPNAISWIGD